MGSRQCIVSFVDPDGIRHAAEVHAQSVFEAAAMALATFHQHECAPGPGGNLEIEVRSPSVRHTVSVSNVANWSEVCTLRKRAVFSFRRQNAHACNRSMPCRFRQEQAAGPYRP